MNMYTKKSQDYKWAYIMVSPVVIGIGIFYIFPFFQNFYYSFTNLGSFGQGNWIGVANYKRIISEPKMLQALNNTFIYTIISVPLGIFCSTLVAVLLNSKIKGLTFYRVMYFLPAVTMPAAIGMVWKWLYNKQFGLINQFLGYLGAEPQGWLSDPKLALYSVILVAIWSSVGYNMIILLAGLQGIPKSYYEAAQIDGAGPFKIFLKITLPLLSPSLFFVTIMSLISAFQVFDSIFMMVNTLNPAFESTVTLVYYFYVNAFEYHDKGYAAAISIVVFFIIMFITMIQLKLQKKLVNY